MPARYVGRNLPRRVFYSLHANNEQDEYLLTDCTPSVETYEALASPHASPLDIPTQHPAFQFTRSYTLAEAITPIEDQYPRLIRSPNNTPEASSIPTGTSPAAGSDTSAGALVDPMDADPSYHDGRSNSIPSSTPTPPPRPYNEPTPHAQPPRQRSLLGPTGPGHSASTHRTASSSKSAGEVVGRPGESVIKLDVQIPREPKKKPLMACLFCRERKIACGHPSPDDKDRRCKYVTLTPKLYHDALILCFGHSQCRRRDLICEFPKECRRGQHKRTPRLARMNAIVNGEPLPDDDILFIHPQFPQTAASPATATFLSSPVMPKSKAKPAVALSKDRRKSAVKPVKQDVQAAAERRAIVRLQRQMSDQQQRQRLSQQQRALMAGPSAA